MIFSASNIQCSRGEIENVVSTCLLQPFGFGGSLLIWSQEWHQYCWSLAIVFLNTHQGQDILQMEKSNTVCISDLAKRWRSLLTRTSHAPGAKRSRSIRESAASAAALNAGPSDCSAAVYKIIHNFLTLTSVCSTQGCHIKPRVVERRAGPKIVNYLCNLCATRKQELSEKCFIALTKPGWLPPWVQG